MLAGVRDASDAPEEKAHVYLRTLPGWKRDSSHVRTQLQGHHPEGVMAFHNIET